MLVHDLRNPISVISTGLDMLTELHLPGETGEYVRAVLSAMGHSVRRMQRLVDTLLDIARMEEGVMTFQLAPPDMGDLITEQIDEMRPLASRLGITLEQSVAEKLPAVLADRYVIQRVLANLLDNALKFTPRGGRVRISACPDGDRVRVEMTDTGPGIPPEAHL